MDCHVAAESSIRRRWAFALLRSLRRAVLYYFRRSRAVIAIAKTSRRVESHTADYVNDQIQRQTEANVACFAELGREAIDARLADLDEEWDVERCLETMAPIFSLAGICLGLTKSRRWFALPIVVQTFFLQHAIQGWCPPLEVLRRLGIRTAGEIDTERNALKALRGDYRRVSGKSRNGAARKALRAAKR